MEKSINNLKQLKPNERNYWLDNVKFFLIVLVVLGHFISGFKKNESIDYLYTFIYLFHMPLFIFISGYFSKNTDKAKDRILKFTVIYLIMQILQIVLFDKKITFLTPCFALWYLQVIIIYNLLLPIIDKEKPLILLIISFALGLLIGFENNAGTIASLSRIFTMFPFFVMGYVTSNESINKLKNKKIIIIAIGVLVLVALVLPYIMDNVKNYDDILWGKSSYDNMKIGNIGILYRGGWYILATLISFCVLSLVPKKKIPLISKFGTRTLQVYCLHIIVYLFFKQTQIYKNINTEFELICLILGTIALTFILSLKVFSYPFDFIMKNKYKLILNKYKLKNAQEE